MANDDGLTAQVEDSQTVLSGGPETATGEAPAEEQDGSVEQPAEGNVPPKWTEQLPRDYREKFSTFESYKDFVNAAAEALEVKDSAIIKPAEDAPQEDWDRFYASVGRPDDPDGYELPNTDKYGELAGAFKEQAHALGLTTQQAKNLFEWYQKQDESAIEADRKRIQEEAQSVQEKLKADWGDKFDDQMKNIDRFKKRYGSEELAQELQNPAVGNNIELIKALAQAGSDLAPDSLIEGDMKPDKPEAAQHFQYEWMREAYPKKDF